MNLAPPGNTYSRDVAVSNKRNIEAADLRNRKKGTDVELGTGEKLIVRSPNGARWQIEVSNTGTVSAVAL